MKTVNSNSRYLTTSCLAVFNSIVLWFARRIEQRVSASNDLNRICRQADRLLFNSRFLVGQRIFLSLREAEGSGGESAKVDDVRPTIPYRSSVGFVKSGMLLLALII
ncbi:hypothetical protein RRG08_048496, partial [Elysia crispata]